MSVETAAPVISQPDPEEIPADALIFPGAMVALALTAYYFSNILPAWKPLTWWLLVAFTGTLRLAIIRRTKFDSMPEQRRRWLLRGLIWVYMASISSGTYFLYVPGDIAMQALLTVYLLGTATVLITHLAGMDWVRIMVSLLILGTPNALHLIIEGLTLGQTASWVLGCCTLFVPIPLAQLTGVHMRLMRTQFESRMQAESAARAMSAVAIAKSRFFAAISHDLRQPVHAIGLYLDAIERVVAESGNPQARHAVVGITLSWQTLNDLLSKVLDLARLEANMEQPDLRVLALAPLVKELILQHSPVAERNGVRLVALVKSDCMVYADELMLKRVLSNLLGNAIKYSPPGRAVVIAVRPAGDQWKIQVRDAGCGIAEKDQALIFSEFVQINNQSRDPSQGLGLGLAIAKRLSELLSGAISVRSEPGRGCCMTLTLSRHLPDLAQKPEPVPGVYPMSQGDLWGSDSRILLNLKVLLVEDDLLVGNAMVQLIQAWGGDVYWAKTAAAARLNASERDIAICDVRLPENESGLDLAKLLQIAGTQVILISGETDQKARSDAAQHGINLLTKPVSPKNLMHALASIKTLAE
ncbi:MAG: hybrid sensor histidine kinase/response regulator [Undibacterium umbellatum]|uniref:ATP-binding response regulator n=1 Tax=Undibacterium umbellatum TaxID=2762300 RepID=UPI003BB60937